MSFQKVIPSNEELLIKMGIWSYDENLIQVVSMEDEGYFAYHYEGNKHMDLQDLLEDCINFKDNLPNLKQCLVKKKRTAVHFLKFLKVLR